MKNYLFIVFASLMGSVYSQINGGPINVPSDGIIDGITISEIIPTKRMIPYEYVRESDVIWSKRVWRSIDLREKVNHSLYYPLDEHTSSGQYVRNSSRWSLWTILRQHIINGDITLFSTYNPYQFDILDGDMFKYPIKPEMGKDYATDTVFRDQVFYYLGKLGPESDVPLTGPDGEPLLRYNPVTKEQEFVYGPRDTFWIDSKDIVQYHIKEDWFFDKERSVLDVRILGLAPVIYDYDMANKNQIIGMRELFWVYFPQCRYVLNNYFVFNERNDAQWMSFDDLFWKRKFNSYIYKESNVFDRSIDKYRSGLDAQHESERIQEEIRTFESDVWNF